MRLFTCLLLNLMVFCAFCVATSTEVAAQVQIKSKDDGRPGSKRVKRGLLMLREEDEIVLQRMDQKSTEQHLADLAKLYQEAVSKQDHDKSFTVLAEMAGYNHLGAQEALALAYYNGQGVEKSFSKALFWFEKSAYNERPVAMHYLGSMYLNGQGLEPDFIQAYKWFSLAVRYYPDGPDKEQAVDDQKNILARLSPEIKERVEREIEEWITQIKLKKQGKSGQN